MANNEADALNRAQQTVRDATDLSHGADNAAMRLQTEVYQNYQSMGGGQDYKTYLDKVTASLQHNPAFDEVAASWTNHNSQRYDMDGNNRLDQRELNAGINASQDPLERAILVNVRDNYETIKHAGGDGFLGIRHDAVEQDDIDGFVGERQHQRDVAAETGRVQAQSRQLMQPLLATNDGNPDRSLFSVLDNVTGGRKDGDVSRHDLESFVDKCDRAALDGADVSQGAFTRTNRDYAANLAQNWDSPEVVALRGMHQVQEGHTTRERSNPYITEQSLLAASGYAQGTNLFQTFEKPKPQPVVPEVDPNIAKLAEARAKFQQDLEQHVRAETHYTVKPGQGFDRIARDVIRTHSHDDSYRDEHVVVAKSDEIARMNGRIGRLSKDPMLHPGDDLTVFDEAWVQQRIAESMKQFEASTTVQAVVPTVPAADDAGAGY